MVDSWSSFFALALAVSESQNAFADASSAASFSSFEIISSIRPLILANGSALDDATLLTRIASMASLRSCASLPVCIKLATTSAKAEDLEAATWMKLYPACFWAPPVFSCRILVAVSKASISCARLCMETSHSCARSSQSACASFRDLVSSANSFWASAKSPVAAASFCSFTAFSFLCSSCSLACVAIWASRDDFSIMKSCLLCISALSASDFCCSALFNMSPNTSKMELELRLSVPSCSEDCKNA
mmetsp:Transcript_10747/g.25658  ORF Transcript_10747/g.25658 Transcript_10747/m.25658 type:complete len:246 (-) Transcript_10747:654-1391(-)